MWDLINSIFTYESVREEYLRNHLSWFLANHQNREEKFWDDVNKKYASRPAKSRKLLPELFDR